MHLIKPSYSLLQISTFPRQLQPDVDVFISTAVLIIRACVLCAMQLFVVVLLPPFDGASRRTFVFLVNDVALFQAGLLVLFLFVSTASMSQDNILSCVVDVCFHCSSIFLERGILNLTLFRNRCFEMLRVCDAPFSCAMLYRGGRRYRTLLMTNSFRRSFIITDDGLNQCSSSSYFLTSIRYIAEVPSIDQNVIN